MTNPAYPFDVCLTPYTTREGKRECGFWVREDLREELVKLLREHKDDAHKVGWIMKRRGLDVAIQQWTWQEAELNNRMFGGEAQYPDVGLRELVKGMKRHPIRRIEDIQ